MSVKREENVLAKGGLCVNCRISGGKLIPERHFVKYGTSLTAKFIFAERSHSLKDFFACDGKDLYVSINGIRFVSRARSEGEYPFLIEEIKDGVPRVSVLNGEYAVANFEKSFTTFDVAAPMRCGVMHCGRLFGVLQSDGFRLCWSGEGGAEDWSNGLNSGGYLVLDPDRGEVRDILEYGEKLVLIREFGLTLLNMFGSPENFSVELTDTDTDEIYAKTARVVCGRLLFFTASGLCCYAGGAVTHINHGCGTLDSPVCSAEFGGKYYLSCYSEELAARAVLCYDPENGEGFLIDFAADAMCGASMFYAYNASGAHRLEGGGEFTYTADGIDFGTGAKKTLTSVCIKGRADVEISNGRVTRLFRGASGVVRTGLRGESFKIRVSGSGAVASLTATAEVMNEI